MGIPLQVAQVPLRVTPVQGLVSHLLRVFFLLSDVVATDTYRVLEGEGLMCSPIQRQRGDASRAKPGSGFTWSGL